ncbi:hypothetical protein BU26DRAFT_254494 [Trematosphaeria pertusa]|uniref:Uncharacterized protein n=1 Tax=Trematosphaeria pertusa TaxID=390896 RepID=A0A6A6IR44_9PLEO|nr:uncharacterized protein BU26DRAFT_254494 [Trematosphaeria pertusa]KAF2252272.1 hypothetical protein BU26DRAFT_254494 [Trematosphaeria pertusa]
MPPPPSLPTGQSRISNSSASNGFGYAQLSKIFLLVLVVATGIRLAIINFMTRKRRIATSYQQIQEKDPRACQAPREKDLRQARVPQSKDHPASTFKPVYPWTSPPQPLPGPYDPRLYPLPTVRRHSYDPSVLVPEQDSTISYTRRVSTNSIPPRQAEIHGTVTTSMKGWRRNQWVVSGE